MKRERQNIVLLRIIKNKARLMQLNRIRCNRFYPNMREITAAAFCPANSRVLGRQWFHQGRIDIQRRAGMVFANHTRYGDRH
jgi:hypothetical protein